MLKLHAVLVSILRGGVVSRLELVVPQREEQWEKREAMSVWES